MMKAKAEARLETLTKKQLDPEDRRGAAELEALLQSNTQTRAIVNSFIAASAMHHKTLLRVCGPFFSSSFSGTSTPAVATSGRVFLWPF